ncbi:MAG: glycosyltransferase [Planctomycetia bacterium]|nr:glycosyltransferase [Planctomycetia bacterium]
MNTDDSIKISVIIPVFNAEEFLAECLESALNQTLSDIEILCIDDGSTDGSAKILDEYALRDSRIHVIHKENHGASAARNEGIKIARGKYIAFLDADDTITLDMCEKSYIHAEYTNADLTAFFANYDPRHNFFDPLYQKLEYDEYFGYDKFSVVLSMNWTIWGKLWKTSFLQENNILFPPEIRAGHDQYFCIKGAFLANKISVFYKRLYNYRCNPKSLVYIQEGKNCITRIEPFFMALRELPKLGADSDMLQKLSKVLIVFISGVGLRCNSSYWKEYDDRFLYFIHRDHMEDTLKQVANEKKHLRKYLEYLLRGVAIGKRPKMENNGKSSIQNFGKCLEKIFLFPLQPFISIRKYRKAKKRLLEEQKKQEQKIEQLIEQKENIILDLEQEIIQLRRDPKI